MRLLEDGGDNRGIGEDDEAEAAGLGGDSVTHDDGVGNLAVPAEMVSQPLLRRVPAYAADEELRLVGERVHRRCVLCVRIQSRLQIRCLPLLGHQPVMRQQTAPFLRFARTERRRCDFLFIFSVFTML